MEASGFVGREALSRGACQRLSWGLSEARQSGLFRTKGSGLVESIIVVLRS